MPKYRKKPVVVDAIQVKEYIKYNFWNYDGIRIFYENDGKMRKIKLNWMRPPRLYLYPSINHRNSFSQ